jgi:hypothetical protein
MSIDIKNEIQNIHDSWDFTRAKFWFWPIVFGFTLIFGLLAGIKGAFVGFLYGVAAGLFLIHESLPGNKK